MPKPNVDVGRNRRIRTIETEERIVEMIEQNPTISTRAIGRELDINHITVYKVLKSELLYPFHRTRVQALNMRDHRARENFCHWLLITMKPMKIFGKYNMDRRITIYPLRCI